MVKKLFPGPCRGKLMRTGGKKGAALGQGVFFSNIGVSVLRCLLSNMDGIEVRRTRQTRPEAGPFAKWQRFLVDTSVSERSLWRVRHRPFCMQGPALGYSPPFCFLQTNPHAATNSATGRATMEEANSMCGLLHFASQVRMKLSHRSTFGIPRGAFTFQETIATLIAKQRVPPTCRWAQHQ